MTPARFVPMAVRVDRRRRSARPAPTARFGRRASRRRRWRRRRCRAATPPRRPRSTRGADGGPLRTWHRVARSPAGCVRCAASVQIATRRAAHTSNACVSSSSFASVLIAERCASAASHVPPTSTSSGSCRPSGHAGDMNRVQPTITPSATRRWTKGAHRCFAASASSPSTYRRACSSPSGTPVKPNVDRSPEPAAAIASMWSIRSRSSVTCAPDEVSDGEAVFGRVAHRPAVWPTDVACVIRVRTVEVPAVVTITVRRWPTQSRQRSTARRSCRRIPSTTRDAHST